MSIKAMSWTWLLPLKATQKLVLLALADHADDRGVCWPGLDGLSNKCGMSRSTLIEHINTLERLGIISKQKRYSDSGFRTSNLYVLNVELTPESLSVKLLRSQNLRSNSSELSSDLPLPQVRILDGNHQESLEKTSNMNIYEQSIITIPLKDETEFSINKSYVDEMKKLYPSIDIEQELRNIRGWNLSNPLKRKDRRGIMKHINAWLCKAQKQNQHVAPIKQLGNELQKLNNSTRATVEENFRAGQEWKSTNGNIEAERFVVMMCGIAEQYHQKRLSKELFQMYWKDLKDFKQEIIEQATNVHTKTPGEGKFLPQPATLIEIIKSNAKPTAEEQVSKFLAKANEFIDQKNREYQLNLKEEFDLTNLEQFEMFHKKASIKIIPNFSKFDFEDKIISTMLLQGEEIKNLLKLKREDLVNKYIAYLVAQNPEDYLTKEQNKLPILKIETNASTQLIGQSL